jgi:hypothetical protein
LLSKERERGVEVESHQTGMDAPRGMRATSPSDEAADRLTGSPMAHILSQN